MACGDALERRFRTVRQVNAISLAVGVVAVALHTLMWKRGWTLPVAAVAFAVFFLTSLWAYVAGFRCATCGWNLGDQYRRRMALWGAGPPFTCPRCGESSAGSGEGRKG
jgi:hypothetical protein